MLERHGKFNVMPPLQHALHGVKGKNNDQIRQLQEDCHVAVKHRLIWTSRVSSDCVGQKVRQLQADHIQNDKVRVLQPSI